MTYKKEIKTNQKRSALGKYKNPLKLNKNAPFSYKKDKEIYKMLQGWYLMREKTNNRIFFENRRIKGKTKSGF